MKSFPKRKQPRLASYNYSLPGGYFVTICSYDRESIFGHIHEFKMYPNDIGSIAAQKWLEIPTHFENVSMDAYVVMPNHLHGIVIIKEQTNATLGQIIGWYKFQAMQEINSKRRTPGRRVWQRGYYEHIIRRTENMVTIREYIDGNPAKWAEDEYNRM